MATGPIESAVADAERVAKKQKTCAASTSKGLDTLLHMLQTAKELVDSTPGDPAPSFLNDLYTQLNDAKVVATITNDTKELHSAVSKLGKVCTCRELWCNNIHLVRSDRALTRRLSRTCARHHVR